MQKIKKCVIPAAGFGTRFLPASKALPKEMFPIIDKPVMQYLVEEAISAGCEDIIIITWRSKRAIEDHFDSNFELESKLEASNKTDSLKKVKSLNNMANIVYVRQPYPRWDWEAILRAKSFIWDEPFLVLFWDDIIDNKKTAAQQLVETYERKNTPVISTVKVSDSEVSSYGIIESASQEWSSFLVDKFLEKPDPSETLSRNGVVWKYVLTSDIFKYLEEAESQRTVWEIRLADAFELMRQKQDIYWLEIEWKRYDTGSKIGFLEATVNYALKHDELKDDFIEIIKKLNIK
jgi:UTP--glucose-1-phosphate uridylyltransferase